MKADDREPDAELDEAGKKKRTFRKFTFRGVDLDQLLDLSSEQLIDLFHARVRRKFGRGLKRKPMALIKKLRKAKKETKPQEKPAVVKTHLRNMIIVPEMIGSQIGIYNGKTFNQVEIKPEMVGHYLGEFSITYKPVKHGRPGIGATHSSRFSTYGDHRVTARPIDWPSKPINGRDDGITGERVDNLEAKSCPLSVTESRVVSGQKRGQRFQQFSTTMNPPTTAPPSPSPSSAATNPSTVRRRVVALWPYEAIEDNELSFKGGQVFELVDECNADWWEGVLDGVQGYFPANRVSYLALPTPTPDASPRSLSGVSAPSVGTPTSAMSSPPPSVLQSTSTGDHLDASPGLTTSPSGTSVAAVSATDNLLDSPSLVPSGSSPVGGALPQLAGSPTIVPSQATRTETSGATSGAEESLAKPGGAPLTVNNPISEESIGSPSIAPTPLLTSPQSTQSALSAQTTTSQNSAISNLSQISSQSDQSYISALTQNSDARSMSSAASESPSTQVSMAVRMASDPFREDRAEIGSAKPVPPIDTHFISGVPVTFNSTEQSTHPTSTSPSKSRPPLPTGTDPTHMSPSVSPTPPAPDSDSQANAGGDFPLATPYPWIAVEDEHGQTYYYDEVTGDTTWEVPEGFVAGSRETEEEDGDGEGLLEVDGELVELGYNLPPRWRATRDSESQIYYFHEETGETRWERPEHNGDEHEIETVQDLVHPHMTRSPQIQGKRIEDKELPEPPDGNPIPPPLLVPSPAAKAMASGGLQAVSRSPANASVSVRSTDSRMTDEDPDSKSENAPLFTQDEDDDAVVAADITREDLGFALDPIPPDYVLYEGTAQLRLDKGEDRFIKKDWKTFHLVLCDGCVVAYKETTKKEPRGLPLGHVDIAGARLELASKDQTRKKHAIAMHCRTGNRYLVLTRDDQECTTWLAAAGVAASTRESTFAVLNAVLKYESTIADKKRMIPRFLERKPEKIAEGSAVSDKDRRTSGKADPMKPSTTGSHGSLLDEDGDKQKKKGFGGLFAKRQPNVKEPPDTKVNVFGGLLEAQLAKTPGRRIPRIVELCTQEVEDRGLDSQGIYRLSGNSAIVQKIRLQFNSNPDPDTVVLSEDDTADINNLTSLLKLYFRELQNPLIPFEMYEHFVEASRILDYDERLYEAKRLVDAMPVHNREVLEYLIRHLQKVTAKSDINKMEPNNIAIVFGVLRHYNAARFDCHLWSLDPMQMKDPLFFDHPTTQLATR
ncbi:ribosomal protein S15 [Gonapodya sp. JEL0774]|nr:ribosomal protein S15 [Gonapodya sp. JEL0774]